MKQQKAVFLNPNERRARSKKILDEVSLQKRFHAIRKEVTGWQNDLIQFFSEAAVVYPIWGAAQLMFIVLGWERDKVKEATKQYTLKCVVSPCAPLPYLSSIEGFVLEYKNPKNQEAINKLSEDRKIIAALLAEVFQEIIDEHR